VIDRGQLAVLAVAVAGQRLVDCGGGGEALLQQVEHVRAEGRQRDVLGRDRTDTRPQPGAACADGDARRADGDAQLAGVGATADD
jgi:hypothetical protein